jgi:hypothetical protein
VVRKGLGALNSLIERLNAELIVALSFCIAIWMVLVAAVEAYVF